MYITVNRTSTTEYTDIPTGHIEVSSLKMFCAQHALIPQNDGKYIAEWGNGEGFDTFEIEAESPVLDITLPSDMLWQDNDPADFWADETEQFFIDQFRRLLYAAGYEAKVVFGHVTSMKIEDEDGYVDDDRLEQILTILDRVQPEYIESNDDVLDEA